ncbi:hypothetical protein JG688_00002699 [Phytophthora aleatoria]|uniref:Dynein heavy chain n=1 Tax=Phytophthora aleatoria TaxID=2496075 RepID=A0A8J5IV60_9STRA|nr:hypothetical protein JG688_00002699 [Phytophthora aleatoria]
MFKVYVEASMEDSIQGGDGDNDGGEVSSEGMDLDILIMEDSIFVETLQSLNTIVLDAYDHAEDNCGELAIFLERYQENGNFCKLVSDPSRYLNTDVHDFRGYLDKFLQEAQDVDFVADSAPSGLLLLDRVKLNGYLKPSPRKCLDGLYKLIPTVLHLLNENLTNEYTVANDGISTIPTTVEAFSGSLALWRELQTGQEDMEEKYNGVRSLYHLLEEYRVKMTDTDQMNAFVLTQKRSQLKASIELFESNCDQYVAKFGVELEARLPSLVSNRTTVTNALSNPILFDLKSDINDTIVYLTQIEDDVLQLEAAVKQHFDYEKTLGLPMTTAFDEMDELKADLALKIDLWKAFRGWSSAVFSWEKLQFPDEIDFGSITEHIERLYAQITKWEQKLSEGMGPLCTNLRSSVEEYRATMPILTDLRCQSFEERHFIQLRELLGFNIRHLNLSPGSPNASVITLGELVKMHLSPFGLQIDRIATDATQERQLKDMLTKIVTLWDRLEFDVKPYKRSKDYYILDSLEGVYTMLEESLVNMTASDLDQALPALNAAVAALDSLDKKDISEVKGFVKPPQAVQVVMEAVCIMLGEKADWDNSKRILSRSTFMAELKEYDKDNIPPVILKKIRKYIESPEFAVEEVKKVSHAAMSLCMWVHAIDTYARVVKEVAPKRQRLAEMNAVLEVANTKLESKQQELAKVLDKVRKLKEECDATLKEKQCLLDESVLTQLRLQNAEKLTEGLSDERTDAERFRLYLTTKLANPHFVPDVYIRVNVINFTVTSDGLEEQLLSDVVQRERMEVEERKHTLLASIARDQKQLQDLEIRILNLLTDAKGNILDDVELIRTLETSKQTSNVVAQRLSESEATKQEVLEIRNQYQGVAVRGAMLFFVIADLADIDPMYQFSLEYFDRLFTKSLNEAPVKRNLSERLVGLQHHITLAVYRNICRGLFKAHKQLFALVVCLKIMISAGELNQCDVVLLDRLVVDIDMPTSTEAESTNLNDSSSLNPPNDDVIGDLKHSADAVNQFLDDACADVEMKDVYSDLDKKALMKTSIMLFLLAKVKVRSWKRNWWNARLKDTG